MRVLEGLKPEKVFVSDQNGEVLSEEIYEELLLVDSENTNIKTYLI